MINNHTCTYCSYTTQQVCFVPLAVIVVATVAVLFDEEHQQCSTATEYYGGGHRPPPLRCYFSYLIPVLFKPVYLFFGEAVVGDDDGAMAADKIVCTI